MTESWSPLGGHGADVLRDPARGRPVAERHGRTPAQVVLRWHLELGLVRYRSPATPIRLRQNLDVFDFSLSTDDVAAISALDRGDAAGADSDVFGH